MHFFKILQKLKSTPPWFINKIKNAIRYLETQALKRFGETPTAFNRTRLLIISQKTNFTVTEAK